MSRKMTAAEWLIHQKDHVPHRPITISITGGKGGVGKTSIALKFAQELLDYGKRVLLIDFDTNLSNTRIKLGLPLHNTLGDLLQGKLKLHDAIYRGPRFHLLSGGNGDLDFFESQDAYFERFIIDIIHQVEREYDVILIDCPAGLGKQSLNLNAYCDHRVVVVTPDRSSVTDAYGLIKILKTKFGVQENHLLINKVESFDQYGRVIKTLSETAETFLQVSTPVLGMISKVVVSHSNFDHFFLFDQTAKCHQDFIKVLGAMTEKCLDDHPAPKLEASREMAISGE